MKKANKIMRIVLIKDVPNLGQAGEVKDVRPGFARNYLIAKNFAVLLQDPQAKVLMSKYFRKKKAEREKHEELVRQVPALEGKKAIFSVKVNKKGEPYQAINRKDIAEKLAIDEGLIEMAKPIKTLGAHQIKIKSGDLKAEILVVVKAEK